MTALEMDEPLFPPLFDVGAVWTILWRRRLTVLASVGVALALALAYLAVTRPVYTATASLLIDPRDARPTGFESVLPGIGPDSAAVASQVFVMESRDLLMAVFDSEGIGKDAEFTEGGLLSLFTGAESKDAAFRRFQRRVTVERAGLTYVIDVSFKSRDPDKAARIANAIVERYRSGLAGERETANSDVRARLSGRIGPLQQNVADAERAIAAFKAEHRILDPAAGGTLQSQIDQITERLTAARADADKAEARHAQALATGTGPAGFDRLAQILSSPATDKLREDYNRRAADLASQETIYQPRHPAIRRLRSEMEGTKRLMAAEAARITRELKAQSDIATQTVAALETKLDALRQDAQESERALVELRRLEAKAQAARSVLDDVMKRAEETAQMGGLQRAEARVIGAAAPPTQPTWPLPFLLLPVSAGLGLVAGCALALACGRPAETPKPPEKALPESLGAYRPPGLPGTSPLSRIRAMRRRFLQSGGEAFSRETLRLVRRIAARLEERPGPYALAVSALRSPQEARLATAMIGIGLQQAGQNVLVIEEGAARGDGVFVNGASGLPTLMRAAPLEALPAEAGAFDFLLLTGNAAHFAGADLILFALSAAAMMARLSASERKV